MIDRLDRKILQILQEDATVPVAEIGRRVGLSTTPCWRRIQKLEEDGVITGRVALLDPKKVNTKVTAFVAITTNQHNDEWLRRFAEVIRDFPEVVEFYRMAGQVDYLLRVVVPDIEAYDNLYKRLIARIDIADVSTTFAMEQIKYTTELPLSYIAARQGKGEGEAPPEASARGLSRSSCTGSVSSLTASLPIQRADLVVGGGELLGQRQGRAVQRLRVLADLAERPVDRLPDEVARVGGMALDESAGKPAKSLSGAFFP